MKGGVLVFYWESGRVYSYYSEYFSLPFNIRTQVTVAIHEDKKSQAVLIWRAPAYTLSDPGVSVAGFLTHLHLATTKFASSPSAQILVLYICVENIY